MPTKTSICNLALSAAEANATIADIETEQSVEAQACRQWYNVACEQMLAMYDWSFARKRIRLALHTDPPPAEDDPGDFTFRYACPLDCISIRQIRPFDPLRKQMPFRREIAPDGSMSVVTDIAGASMRYTFNQKETLFFTPGFAVGFAHLLASYLIGPLEGSMQKKTLLINQANVLGVQAAEQNFQSEQDDREDDAPWVQVRDTFTPFGGFAGGTVFDNIGDLSQGLV